MDTMRIYHVTDITDYHEIAVFFEFAECVNFFKAFRGERKWVVYVTYIDEEGNEVDWDLLNWADIDFEENENECTPMDISCNVKFKAD